MNFDDYQEAAEVTAGFQEKNEERLVCAVLAMAGEVGELANHIKKGIWHGHGVDRSVVLEELGDILWYVAETATSLDINLESVAEHNVNKLRSRYPGGFSEDASRNRKG